MIPIGDLAHINASRDGFSRMNVDLFKLLIEVRDFFRRYLETMRRFMELKE